MWKWSGLALLMLTRVACDDPQPVGEMAAEPAPEAPPAEAPIDTGEVVTARAPAPEVDPFAELLTGATRAAILDAKAYMLDHSARVGVYFGLPQGWRYDDPSYLSLSPADAARPGRVAVLRLEEPGLGAPNLASLLKRGSLPAQITDARWQNWHDGVVGRGRWPAKIARGEATPVIKSHGALVTLAAVIDVPGTRAVGFVAAWPKAAPELEATMVDVARHLHRCKVQVGRGCVAE